MCFRNLKKYSWGAPVLIFAAALLFSRWFWPGLTFPDGDSFYHLKATELLANGIPREFPWLPFTLLRETYIDHHLLYHVLLFPFVQLLGPFVGLKIATVLFAAGAITAMYFVLRALQFRAPAFFTTLLFLAPGFMVRLHIAKAPGLLVIMVLIGLYCLLKHKPIALAVLAGIYVWTHGGWPLLGFITVIWVFARSFLDASLHTHTTKLKAFWSSLRLPEHTRPVLAVIIGSLAGLLINPYFPKHFLFYWAQFVQIGVVNYASKIGVGVEWYGMSFGELFISYAPLFFLFALALVFLVLEAQRRLLQHKEVGREEMLRAFGLVVLAGVFFVLTVRSRRNIEYFVPLAVLALASLTTLVWPSVCVYAQRTRAWFQGWVQWFAVAVLMALLCLVAALPGAALLQYRNVLVKGHSPHYFNGATTWLQTHVAPGAAVFHDRWDMFPMLWYGDDRLRYISGLDPTFFYLENQARYELWRSIVNGEYAGDVVGAIKDTFGAQHVLIAGKHNLFALQLELSTRARQVYKDEHSTIFEFSL